jgi:hypothetical protein
MANTANSNISAQHSVIGIGNFSAVSACTTRGPTATANLAAANIIVIIPTTTEDTPVSRVSLKGSSTAFTSATAAQTLTLWVWDGTTAYPFKEILLSVTTPSTIDKSFEIDYPLTDFSLPIGYALYGSTSITTTASTTAFVAHAFGSKM